ncbi:MAG: GntR family transcriptional regulator [Protaetiibacter sp.]
MSDNALVGEATASAVVQLKRGKGVKRSGAPLAERAYRELRNRVIKLELFPGEQFTEARLSEETGIGQTPIREALGLLARDGLVIKRPQVGYMVTPLTVQGIRDLFDLRAIVESAAVDLATDRLTPRDWDELESHMQSRYSQDDPESIDQFLDDNQCFHSIITAASGNKRLAAVVDDVIEESRRIIHLRLQLEPQIEKVLHEHTELLDALKRRDRVEARRITMDQALRSKEECVSALVSNSRLMEVPLPL